MLTPLRDGPERIRAAAQESVPGLYARRTGATGGAVSADGRWQTSVLVACGEARRHLVLGRRAAVWRSLVLVHSNHPTAKPG